MSYLLTDPNAQCTSTDSHRTIYMASGKGPPANIWQIRGTQDCPRSDPRCLKDRMQIKSPSRKWPELTKYQQNTNFSSFCDLNCRWVFIKNAQSLTKKLMFSFFPVVCWSNRPSLPLKAVFKKIRNMHLHLVTRRQNRKIQQISSILISLSIEISCFNIFVFFLWIHFPQRFWIKELPNLSKKVTFLVAPSVAQSEMSLAFRENMLLHLVITIFVARLADSKRGPLLSVESDSL